MIATDGSRTIANAPAPEPTALDIEMELVRIEREFHARRELADTLASDETALD